MAALANPLVVFKTRPANNNNSSFRLFTKATPMKVCCSRCTSIVSELRKSTVPHLELAYLGNEQVVHKVVDSLLESNNRFNDYSNIFQKFFSSPKSDNLIIYKQFYEQLVLAVCRYEFSTSVTPVEVVPVEDGIQSSVNIHLPFVSVSQTSWGKFKDIPRSLTRAYATGNRDFDNFSYAVSVWAQKSLPLFQQNLLTRYLTAKSINLMRTTAEDPTFINGRRNIAYRYLLFANSELSNEFEKIREQRVFIKEIVGESGIGKSQAVQNLKQFISAMLPVIPLSEVVYSRANDYWWNGYQGQPIILYDDFTHIRKKLKFDLNFELISVASGTLRNPPMAFTKDMVFTSALAVVTSNIPVMTTVDNVETLNALKRRISSERFVPMNGLTVLVEGVRRYRVNGLLLSSLTAKSDLVCILGEVFKIFKESSQTTLECVFGSFDLEFEEESDSNTFSMLTSSVPESCSAIVEKGGALEEQDVSAAEILPAQVNVVVNEESMLSKLYSYAPFRK